MAEKETRSDQVDELRKRAEETPPQHAGGPQ